MGDGESVRLCFQVVDLCEGWEMLFSGSGSV